MLGEDEADAALDMLADLAFVEATAEGLALHDAVHTAIVERLRAVDPERFRADRTAAWHHLQSESRAAGGRDLARSTADLLFLIDNPGSARRCSRRPRTCTASSRRASTTESDLRALWHRHDPAPAAIALDAWLERAPDLVRAIRDRAGTVVGCSILADWRDVPHSLERDDPIMAGWAKHAAAQPAPCRAMHPRAPTGALRSKPERDQAGRKPPRGSTSSGSTSGCVRDSAGCTRCWQTHHHSSTRCSCWGSSRLATPFPSTTERSISPRWTSDLDSVDGWLTRMAAAELGIQDAPFLDVDDRTVDLGDHRVHLSPLEFGVLEALSSRRGRPVSRAELIARVWGTTYDGGSNVVDVVVRSLRHKLGPSAARVETTRGVGYCFK